jgi:hypothetical protein
VGSDVVRIHTEPVDSVDEALKNVQECVDHPVLARVSRAWSDDLREVSYCKPLGIVDLASAEEGFKRVVARENEAGEVDEEGAAKVEEDQEEIETSQSQDHVDLGHTGLLLKIVEDFIFGQLETPQVSDEVCRQGAMIQATVGIFAAWGAFVIGEHVRLPPYRAGRSGVGLCLGMTS